MIISVKTTKFGSAIHIILPKDLKVGTTVFVLYPDDKEKEIK
jgi:hypothetical protein